MPIRHIYSTPVSIGAESQTFHFWTSEALYFRNLVAFYFVYEKKNIHENTNTFETEHLLHYVNSKFKCILRDCIFVFL